MDALIASLISTQISSENALLKCFAGRYRRFMARFLGMTVYLGKFFPDGFSDFTEFYLIWCRAHKKYVVSYAHGHDQVLICRDCEEERLSRITSRTDKMDEEFRRICETEDLF